MLDQSPRERMFNVPAVVTGLLAVLAIVHAVSTLLLTPEQYDAFLWLFAFIPARYDASVTTDVAWSGGVGADIWTFVTYALVHANLTHLVVNGVWLLAFCSPLARRFGPLRFLAFMAATAAAGAFAHLVTHIGALVPIVGASASISGAMAAAMRFAFQPGGFLGGARDGEEAHRIPALSLAACLREPRVIVFLLVWFGVNALFGFISLDGAGMDQPLAWQAHIGGFMAGLLTFSFFDPVPMSATAGHDTDPASTIH